MNKDIEYRLERSRLKKIRLQEKDIQRKNGLKKCSRCKELKSIDQFNKSSSKRDGLHGACKNCISQYHKERYIPSTRVRVPGKWSKLNPELRRETRLKHYIENKAHINEIKRLWRHNHPKLEVIQQFKDGLKRKYNLTLEQYQQMIADRNNKCDICGHELISGRKGRYAINVDHKHGTNPIIVRGILCNCCNKVIGYAYDDINILENAIKYLKFHSNKAA